MIRMRKPRLIKTMEYYNDVEGDDDNGDGDDDDDDDDEEEEDG